MQGAACALLATSTAAILAFQLSRRVGQSLAKSAAGKEVEETQSNGMLTRVERAIESGSFQQQVVAVTLLRLTPVVPFRSLPQSIPLHLASCNASDGKLGMMLPMSEGILEASWWWIVLQQTRK